MKISPSILSANFAWLRDDVLTVKDSDYLHVDVMDGHFVPNITFGLPIVKDLKSSVDIPLDVHLMITEPREKVSRAFLQSGCGHSNVPYRSDKLSRQMYRTDKRKRRCPVDFRQAQHPC